MTDLPKINTIENIQQKVKELANANPLLYSNVRKKQEEVINFLLTHSEWLLTLALANATSRYCNACSGHGKFWIITNNDSHEWETCTTCKGSGEV